MLDGENLFMIVKLFFTRIGFTTDLIIYQIWKIIVDQQFPIYVIDDFIRELESDQNDLLMFSCCYISTASYKM